jgi:hypothetical protein
VDGRQDPAQIPKSVLTVIPAHRFTHSPLMALNTTEFVDAYLLRGALPPVGTVCPANPNLFLEAAARSATRSAPLVGLPPDWLLRPGAADTLSRPSARLGNT